ncbi:hypothetical protein [Micromonospora sp. DT31]|uniref:hypothetical protein n=1 Tax=Micromonospora sp. DT31 TaxID=3393434 RepID=UPI003CF52397
MSGAGRWWRWVVAAGWAAPVGGGGGWWWRVVVAVGGAGRWVAEWRRGRSALPAA